VSSSNIDTNGSGFPAESVTVPLICAKLGIEIKENKKYIVFHESFSFHKNIRCLN
jgi:hypothetical protein